MDVSEAEEDDHDNEEEEEAEEDSGKDNDDKPTMATPKCDKPPNKPAKTTPKKATPEPNNKAPVADVDDVNDLASQVRNNLKLNTWFNIDCCQECPIFACIFVDPGSQTRYVYICIELVGIIEFPKSRPSSLKKMMWQQSV